MIPLKQVSVLAPCHKAWDGMEGDAQARFCDSCRHQVHNLSEMSQTEAQQLLNGANGRLCVRFVPDADGAPLTRDELALTPPGRRLSWPRRWAAAASWTVAVLMAGAGLARAAASPKHAPPRPANSGHARTKPPRVAPPITHTMGIVAPLHVTPPAPPHTSGKSTPAPKK